MTRQSFVCTADSCHRAKNMPVLVATPSTRPHGEVAHAGRGRRNKQKILFLVARFEFRSLPSELLIKFANFVLSVFALFQFDLKLIASMAEILLDSASNSDE